MLFCSTFDWDYQFVNLLVDKEREWVFFSNSKVVSLNHEFKLRKQYFYTKHWENYI